jgi:Fe-S oxidoreductase
MTRLFAPGCALFLYKPHLVARIHTLHNQHEGEVLQLTRCCRKTPQLADGTEVINVCPGCDRRYRENYATATTVSLWEILAQSTWFDFPDYGGQVMAINDACPTRDQPRVHDAVRTLLRRMNITVVEPKATRTKAVCCGDSSYGLVPVAKVRAQMALRAAQMPANDVVVYCVSCVKSMFNGGKRPRYLVDLLFCESTLAGTLDPDAWHREIDEFCESS